VFAEQGFTPKYAYDLNNQLKIMSRECYSNADNIRRIREIDEARIREELQVENVEKNILGGSDAMVLESDEQQQQHDEDDHGDNDDPFPSSYGASNSILCGGNEPSVKPRRKRNNVNSELNSVKLGVPFAHITQKYCYNNRTYKNELSNTIESFNMNRAERFEEFFLNDQLSGTRVDNKAPGEFKIFRHIEQTFGQQFAQRINMINDSIRKTPKFLDEPPVTKRYIDAYRRRPNVKNGDLLCSNGALCCFKTFSNDENITYVGKVFWTPREKKILDALSKKKSSTTTGDDEFTTITVKGINNHRKLCIDCILREYTCRVYNNICNEESPEIQMNHFTVIVEPPDGYNSLCCLPQTSNNKPTGIVGFVPMYSKQCRVSTVIQFKKIVDMELINKTTNYIAETNQDF
jgi:hypothetical protein